MQHIWPPEPTQFPATLKISTEVEVAPSMTCTGLGAPRQNLKSTRRQNCLFFSPSCACFSTWSWWYRSSIFHFSSCPLLRSLNLLDLSTSFHLRLPGRFAYCSVSWRQQPLESLNWLTATLLFRDQLVALKWAALCRCHSSLDGKNSLLPQNPGHYQC